ncbi:MAG: YfhO family protein [Candidatus Polarisedimenticolia bacterium]
MKWGRRLALPALLLGSPLVFFHEVCFSDRVYLLRDLHNWYYPWRDLVRRALASGEIPLWNPWSYMGTPLLANMQSAVFYPINICFWLFEFPSAMRLFLVAHFGIIALVMALMLRTLGCRPVSCATGGLAWAYGGWMLVHIEFPNKLSAAGWLPLIMMGLLTWWRGQPARGLILGAAGVALSTAGGYPQTTHTLVLGAGVLWAGWLIRAVATRQRAQIIRAALSYPLVLLVGGLLAGAEIIPFAEVASLSDRATSHDTSLVLQHSLHPVHFLDFVFPHFFGLPGYEHYWGGILMQYWLGHFYVGLPVILLAAAATLALRRRPDDSRRIPSRRWAVAAGLGLLVFSVLACLGIYTPFAPLLVSLVPGLDHWRWWSNTGLLIAFALCWLGPLGLDELLDRLANGPRVARRLALALGLLAAAAAAIAALAFVSPSTFLSAVQAIVSQVVLPPQAPGLPAHIDLVRDDMVRAALILITLTIVAGAVALGRLSPQRAAQAVPLVLLLDLMAGHVGVNFTGSADLYRHEPDTVARLKERLVPGSRFYVTEETLRSDLLMYGAKEDSYYHWASNVFLFNLNLPYGLFSASGGDPVCPRRAALWRQAIEQSPDVARRRNLLAAAGVSQVVHGSPGEPSKLIGVPGVMPRARVVPGLRRITTDTGLEIIASGSWDPSREALVEDDAPANAKPPGEPIPHTIHAVRHTMNTVTVEVSASAPGYLVLSDMMYPGWRATVDGRPAPLFTADHMFRGLELPEGRHTVVYTYRPARVIVGAFVSLAGVAILALAPWVSRRWGPSLPAGAPGTTPARPRTGRTP